MVSALFAAPFPILVALNVERDEVTAGADRDLVVSTVAHVLGALAVLVVAGRLLYARLGVAAPALGILPTAVLCTGIALGLSAPVELAWSDGCNDLVGIAPVLSAAVYELGLADRPSSFVGLQTLVLCV